MLIWEEDGKVKYEYGEKPRVGVSVRVGSYNGRSYSDQDWWQTTPIVEILDESETHVRFRTKSGSIYDCWAE